MGKNVYALKLVPTNASQASCDPSTCLITPTSGLSEVVQGHRTMLPSGYVAIGRARMGLDTDYGRTLNEASLVTIHSES